MIESNQAPPGLVKNGFKSRRLIENGGAIE
jgi:hypothetical protein